MKLVKVILGILLVLVLLVVVGVYWGKNWINTNLESVINADPDRKYNFNFDQMEVNWLRQGININEVTITPIGETEGVFVEGKVLQVKLNGVNIFRLLVNQSLKIQSLSFDQPEFVVHIPLELSEEDKPAEAFQGLFGDILSRGEIRNFELIEAQALFLVGEDQYGSLSNLNVLATELVTDSVRLNYPIPFEFERIHIAFDSIDYQMANGQHFKIGKIDFDTDLEQLEMNTISLLYQDGLRKASTEIEIQVDLIEFKLEKLILSGIEANSNLYSDLDIRARKLDLQGLYLEDFRNKNLPRPADEYKPLFQGMLQNVNFPLKLDTLELTNGTIVYGEAVPGKDEFWQFHLDNLNGDLVKITTIPEIKSTYENLDGKFTGQIQGSGKLNIDLKIPYDRDEFTMDIELTSFPLPKINEILKPIMSGEIVTGQLDRLHILIHADSLRSTNQFQFDYQDLKIEMFQKGTQQKNRLKSTLANMVMNTSNLPADKNYLTAEYTTDRNVYRGPIHLIWQSTKGGIMQIVPGGFAREILSISGN